MPQELLLKSTAKQYFSQYGRIQRVIIKHKSRICVVEYATEKGMQLALTRAGEYNGQTFKVERDFRPIVKKKRTKKETDPDWTLDPDVQHELEAMKGTMALNKDYELRSSGNCFVCFFLCAIISFCCFLFWCRHAGGRGFCVGEAKIGEGREKQKMLA